MLGKRTIFVIAVAGGLIGYIFFLTTMGKVDFSDLEIQNITYNFESRGNGPQSLKFQVDFNGVLTNRTQNIPGLDLVYTINIIDGPVFHRRIEDLYSFGVYTNFEVTGLPASWTASRIRNYTVELYYQDELLDSWPD